MSDIVSVTTKSSITSTTTVTLSDGTVKTIDIREGDHIDGLVYMENGQLKTVNGVVKLIKYSVKAASDKSSVCVHEAVSDFSRRVTPTYLIVDCSSEFSSKVLSIPVTSIRDFPTDNIQTPSGDGDDTPDDTNPSGGASGGDTAGGDDTTPGDTPDDTTPGDTPGDTTPGDDATPGDTPGDTTPGDDTNTTGE